MEAEVDKLELMFQKADSDLDYLQYRLEYEVKINHPHSAGEKNAVAILKELSAIKSRYQALCARFKTVSVEQKETKSCICAILNKTMTMLQELQKQTNLELTLLTEEEKAVTERLKSHVPDVENGILQRNFDGEKISSKEIQRGV
ncbi:similar to RIKEN cDNA 1110001A07 gene, isoform CRA_a [Rattus norvegicus]|uniref:SKA complex subunit 2 n=2 Tax=Rattus norvegicus TaxID=10116 RepID=SKA2_RAT|nr:spindle and kinetochore-associated protein 2 [Rattus norvegicus]Q5I0J4.1 RecName: Full=Spindle and kinetochore-associated protein 2; AltName: Full=Protein FAM33A [Rattus norvegicus]AAH88264.1 Family with sequence similarity 33, member A [Rattus norvegicus]EDM05584.1 similar to RIKEN cDNA 1110001A07 gene, isoform CRA_a [Rattus norvegicus]|eukprot:NP_001009624.1 spindle and kinetochore-associated protein 2 [Rattus norvegicus]